MPEKQLSPILTADVCRVQRATANHRKFAVTDWQYASGFGLLFISEINQMRPIWRTFS